MTTTTPRCAVVFKTYAWDGFVERQARRLAEAAGALDFYVSVDETNGPVGPIPFERVSVSPATILPPLVFPCAMPWVECCGGIRIMRIISFWRNIRITTITCSSSMTAWCNAPLEQFVVRAASRGADVVALPITRPFKKWHWMPYQRDVYPPGEVKLALLNACLFSSRALKLLHQRRLAMGADPFMRQWPSSEVFVPTEVARAGMTWLSLADFGDVSRCDWFPPTMEEDLRPSDGDAFLHPVLDRRRYVSSMLYNRGSLAPGELDRALSRFRREEYAKLIWPAARQGALRGIQHKLLRLRQQVGY